MTGSGSRARASPQPIARPGNTTHLPHARHARSRPIHCHRPPAALPAMAGSRSSAAAANDERAGLAPTSDAMYPGLAPRSIAPRPLAADAAATNRQPRYLPLAGSESPAHFRRRPCRSQAAQPTHKPTARVRTARQKSTCGRPRYLLIAVSRAAPSRGTAKGHRSGPNSKRLKIRRCCTLLVPWPSEDRDRSSWLLQPSVGAPSRSGRSPYGGFWIDYWRLTTGQRPLLQFASVISVSL